MYRLSLYNSGATKRMIFINRIKIGYHSISALFVVKSSLKVPTFFVYIIITMSCHPNNIKIGNM